MAELTFKDSVQTITGTVTSSDALDKWLQDGAWDIINRVKISDPAKLQSFGQEKSISNDAYDINDKIILGVYSSESEYREIPATLKIKAAAVSSIHAATSTNPVYYRENGKLALLPTGNTSPTVSLIDIDSTNLINTKKPSEISYFPDRMKHLISIYASMQQLQFLMKAHSMPLDSTVDLSTITLPIMPITSTASSNMNTWDGSAQSRVIIDNSTLATVPVYNNPVMEDRVKFTDYVSGLSATDPGVFSLSRISPIVPTLNTISVNTTTWVQPEFIAPVFDGVDWDNTNKWIEDEEDPEMLAARVQEISAKAGEFTSKLQESQMRYNKELEIYKAEIQKSIQDASLLSATEGLEIQKYSGELQQYQAEVNTDVQTYANIMGRWTLELNTTLSAWTQEENEKVQRFSGEIQNSLNDFNESNTEYQAKLQIALENARLSSAADGILMQRFKSEVESYMAEVNSKVQEYNAKLQARGLEYQWMQEQYLRMKNQYESGFVPFQAPKEKE